MARAERPLAGEDGPVLRFAEDLRKLRQKAGSPPYRELSRRAHYSSGALSDAAAGRKMPTLPVALAYVRACEGDVDEWESRWHEVVGELSAPEVAEAPDKGPYAGLAAFSEEDAEWFFGRERLVDELCERVREHRFVAVVGPSGSGKSSLLRAGLLHARAAGLRGLATGPVLVMAPSAHPLEELAIRLARLAGGSAAALLTELRGDGGLPAPDGLLLVIDQFEELFTVCRDAAERTRFLNLLDTAEKVGVVIGVRADFYAHCAQHHELVGVLRDAQVVVGPMTTAELRSAVTEPVLRVGGKAETELVSQVVADATGQPGVLPLMSHALLETWRRRRGSTMTLAGYEAAGGMAQAIAHTAEGVYGALNEERQRLARDLFVRLCELGEGTEDTKRRIQRAELDPEVDPVLEQLAQARLVTLDRDTVEITHEALIRCWPQLRGWLDDDRENLRRHRQLTEATTAWESLDHDQGALYRGTRLDLAREIPPTHLSRRERAFLDASISAGKRRVRRSRYLTAVLVVLLVVSAVATVYAGRASSQLTEQLNAALSQKVSAEAVALRTVNRPLAAQLSLAAYRLFPTAEARDGVLSVLAHPITGHTGSVNAAVYSPDGRLLVTGSSDKTVKLWDVGDPAKPVELATAQTGAVYGVAISPDGKTFATAGVDRTVQLWDITDPRAPRKIQTLTGHTNVVYSVAFSPDGKTLGSGSYDQSSRLWDVSNLSAATEIGHLTEYGSIVKQVAFSPDGRTFAGGADDRTVHLWDTTDPRKATPITVLKTGHSDMVPSLTFSPDGKLLATGSDDRTIRLWNMTDRADPKLLTTLTGHGSVVMAVGFSPDSRTLASGADDGTARLWDVSDAAHATQRTVLTGHKGGVQSVRFSPDGTRLATSSTDETAQIQDLDPDQAQASVCALPPPRMTEAEWAKHFPDLDFQPPCP